jgi:hypothetical protein
MKWSDTRTVIDIDGLCRRQRQSQAIYHHRRISSSVNGVGYFHLIGMGLLLIGSTLLLASGETVLALASSTLALVIGFSYTERRKAGRETSA